jgi:hypothetical protein
VESGEWRVESKEWRVASGERRVESGEWRVASGNESDERRTPYRRTAVPPYRLTALPPYEQRPSRKRSSQVMSGQAKSEAGTVYEMGVRSGSRHVK